MTPIANISACLAVRGTDDDAATVPGRLHLDLAPRINAETRKSGEWWRSAHQWLPSLTGSERVIDATHRVRAAFRALTVTPTTSAQAAL